MTATSYLPKPSICTGTVSRGGRTRVLSASTSCPNKRRGTKATHGRSQSPSISRYLQSCQEKMRSDIPFGHVGLPDGHDVHRRVLTRRRQDDRGAGMCPATTVLLERSETRTLRLRSPWCGFRCKGPAVPNHRFQCMSGAPCGRIAREKRRGRAGQHRHGPSNRQTPPTGRLSAEAAKRALNAVSTRAIARPFGHVIARSERTDCQKLSL